MLLASIVALVVIFLLFKSLGTGKSFMKAALYHYHMDQRELTLETHGEDAHVPAIAYRMVVQQCLNMDNSDQASGFCFEVLKHQTQHYGSRKATLEAARQRHFPD
jgi:hypothetical protein